MPEFTVCSKSQVKRTVKRFGATHLLSTLDPGDRVFRPLRIEPTNHLQLWFLDEEDPKRFQAPTIEHAKIILEWSDRLPDDARVVVHCFAGACRSTAIAMALWLQHGGMGGVDAWIKKVRPQACPNLLLAQYFDDLLGQDGRLVSICDEVGRDSINRKWKLAHPEA